MDGLVLGLYLVAMVITTSINYTIYNYVCDVVTG